eukprot:gene3511-6982_t
MQIPYEKRDAGSDIGLGLFSTQHIRVGSLIWRFKAGENVLIYDRDAAYQHLRNKTMAEAQNWLDLTYGLHGKICEILDDGKYMNHSVTPNCKTDANGDVYAITDIHTGEQLFEDYVSFDHPAFLYDLLSKYDCEPDYYNIPALTSKAEKHA